MPDHTRLSANIPLPPEILTLMDRITERTGCAVLLLPVESCARYFTACAGLGTEPVELLGAILHEATISLEQGTGGIHLELWEDIEEDRHEPLH